MATLNCGNCGKVGKTEPITTLVYYKCLFCGAINETKNITLTEWLGFNYQQYKGDILSFLAQYSFEDSLGKSKAELLAGKLSRRQVQALRLVLQDGFREEKSLLQIADDIERRVSPSNLYRIKDGRLVKKGGQKVLAISAQHRPIMFARTESTRAGAEGSLAHYEDGGVERVRWVASLGTRTCPLCEGLNGQVFPLQEAQGMMPRHVFCRCTWVPVTGTGAGVGAGASASSVTNLLSYGKD